jgi:hypothetical protein
MGERLLTKHDVAERYRVHWKTIERLEREGKIPKRADKSKVPIADPRWREADIDAHIASMFETEKAEQAA